MSQKVVRLKEDHADIHLEEGKLLANNPISNVSVSVWW